MSPSASTLVATTPASPTANTRRDVACIASAELAAHVFLRQLLARLLEDVARRSDLDEVPGARHGLGADGLAVDQLEAGSPNVSRSKTPWRTPWSPTV